MPLPEDFDLSNAENIQALKEAGFYTKDDVTAEVAKYNEGVDGKNKELLGTIVKQKEILKSLPTEAEKLVEMGKDPRFKKILEGGFDSYESGLGNELSQRYEALKTDKMIQEQEYKQQEQRLLEERKKDQQVLRNLRIENKLNGLITSNQDKLVSYAIPDMVDAAKRELEIGDKGNLIVLGADGVPRQTAEGPMTEADWLNEKMKSKPHWFKGASAQGSQTLDGREIDVSQMTPAEKRRAARQQRGRG